MAHVFLWDLRVAKYNIELISKFITLLIQCSKRKCETGESKMKKTFNKNIQNYFVKKTDNKYCLGNKKLI